MEPFVSHTGLVAPLDRPNVDTDAIIPKQFLKRVERTGFGQFLFFDWRFTLEGEEQPEFVLNQDRYRNATVLVARRNFGSGSSREHAPWALTDYGFRVVLAPSFADIFYNNCFQNGLLPVVLTEEQVDELFRRAETIPGYRVTIELPAQTVRDEHGLLLSFDVDPNRKEKLVRGLDMIGETLQWEDEIAAYEARRLAEV